MEFVLSGLIGSIPSIKTASIFPRFKDSVTNEDLNDDLDYNSFMKMMTKEHWLRMNPNSKTKNVYCAPKSDSGRTGSEMASLSSPLPSSLPPLPSSSLHSPRSSFLSSFRSSFSHVTVLLCVVFSLCLSSVVQGQGMNPYDLEGAWNYVNEEGIRSYDARLDPSR